MLNNTCLTTIVDSFNTCQDALDLGCSIDKVIKSTDV